VQRNRRIVVIAIALGVALTACGGGSGDTGDSVDVESLELTAAGKAGLVVYQGKCATCHQRDLSGSSGPALGPASSAAAKPTDDLRRTITTGGSGMPAWGGLLSDQQVDDVLAFLSEAQGR